MLESACTPPLLSQVSQGEQILPFTPVSALSQNWTWLSHWHLKPLQLHARYSSYFGSVGLDLLLPTIWNHS